MRGSALANSSSKMKGLGQGTTIDSQVMQPPIIPPRAVSKLSVDIRDPAQRQTSNNNSKKLMNSVEPQTASLKQINLDSTSLTKTMNSF